MTDQIEFGAWLRQRRKEYGYTQEELADLARCSPATIRKLESGERRPSRQIADLLLDQLEVPSSERGPILHLANLDKLDGGGYHAPFTPIPTITRIAPTSATSPAATTPSVSAQEPVDEPSALRTPQPALPML